MKYSIGYQLPDEDDSIVEIARDYPEHVGEVYFAWVGQASGRSPVGMTRKGIDPDAQAVMEEELRALSEMGVDLVLLINAACYGEEAISDEFAERTRALIRMLLDKFALSCVTTTSPFVARVVKQAFPLLEVRASINMRIGTIKGMQYLADCMDGYYMQREFNRDPERIQQIKAWCDENGKSLHMLANSGCLKDCSFQSFHDNLVAHEAGLRQRQNTLHRYPAYCWEYLTDTAHWVAILQNTWIRPEDIHHYDQWFAMAKLATRMHANPRKVVSAYARGRFGGNLLDLMEPGYGPLFAGMVFDNTRFPVDWYERTTQCDKQCQRCDYCQTVLERVLVKVEDLLGMPRQG